MQNESPKFKGRPKSTAIEGYKNQFNSTQNSHAFSSAFEKQDWQLSQKEDIKFGNKQPIREKFSQTINHVPVQQNLCTDLKLVNQIKKGKDVTVDPMYVPITYQDFKKQESHRKYWQPQKSFHGQGKQFVGKTITGKNFLSTNASTHPKMLGQAIVSLAQSKQRERKTAQLKALTPQKLDTLSSCHSCVDEKVQREYPFRRIQLNSEVSEVDIKVHKKLVKGEYDNKKGSVKDGISECSSYDSQKDFFAQEKKLRSKTEANTRRKCQEVVCDHHSHSSSSEDTQLQTHPSSVKFTPLMTDAERQERTRQMIEKQHQLQFHMERDLFRRERQRHQVSMLVPTMQQGRQQIMEKCKLKENVEALCEELDKNIQKRKIWDAKKFIKMERKRSKEQYEKILEDQQNQNFLPELQEFMDRKKDRFLQSKLRCSDCEVDVIIRLRKKLFELISPFTKTAIDLQRNGRLRTHLQKELTREAQEELAKRQEFKEARLQEQLPEESLITPQQKLHLKFEDIHKKCNHQSSLDDELLKAFSTFLLYNRFKHSIKWRFTNKNDSGDVTEELVEKLLRHLQMLQTDSNLLKNPEATKKLLMSPFMQIFDPKEKLDGEKADVESNHLSFDEFKSLLGLEENFDPSAIDKKVLFDTPANYIVVSKDALAIFEDQIKKQSVRDDIKLERANLPIQRTTFNRNIVHQEKQKFLSKEKMRKELMLKELRMQKVRMKQSRKDSLMVLQEIKSLEFTDVYHAYFKKQMNMILYGDENYNLSLFDFSRSELKSDPNSFRFSFLKCSDKEPFQRMKNRVNDGQSPQRFQIEKAYTYIKKRNEDNEIITEKKINYKYIRNFYELSKRLENGIHDDAQYETSPEQRQETDKSQSSPQYKHGLQRQKLYKGKQKGKIVIDRKNINKTKFKEGWKNLLKTTQSKILSKPKLGVLKSIDVLEMFIRETQKILLIDIQLGLSDIESKIECEHQCYKRPKELFQDISNANKFFSLAKKQPLTENDSVDQALHMYFNQIYYQDKCMAKSSIINSVKFDLNLLNAKDIFLSEPQAKAIKQMIEFVKTEPSKHILDVSLVNCGTKDNIFSIILDALISQNACKSLTYIGGEMGQNSQDRLNQILQFNTSYGSKPLEKLTFNNIKFQKEEIFRNFITDLQENENKINHLDLSFISLGSDKKAFEKLCLFIQNQSSLRTLKFQSCNLNIAQLAQVVKSVYFLQEFNQSYNSQNVIQSLDLSYNFIVKSGFDLKNESATQMELFISKLKQIVIDSKRLVHLNLAGMNLGQDNLIAKLIPCIVKSKSLQAVHLGDNNIHDQTLHEILINFGIITQMMQETNALYQQKISNQQELIGKLKKCFYSNSLDGANDQEFLADLNKEIMHGDIKNIQSSMIEAKTMINTGETTCAKELGLGLGIGHNPNMEIVEREMDYSLSEEPVVAGKKKNGAIDKLVTKLKDESKKISYFENSQLYSHNLKKNQQLSQKSLTFYRTLGHPELVFESYGTQNMQQSSYLTNNVNSSFSVRACEKWHASNSVLYQSKRDTSKQICHVCNQSQYVQLFFQRDQLYSEIKRTQKADQRKRISLRAKEALDDSIGKSFGVSNLRLNNLNPNPDDLSSISSGIKDNHDYSAKWTRITNENVDKALRQAYFNQGIIDENYKQQSDYYKHSKLPIILGSFVGDSGTISGSLSEGWTQTAQMMPIDHYLCLLMANKFEYEDAILETGSLKKSMPDPETLEKVDLSFLEKIPEKFVDEKKFQWKSEVSQPSKKDLQLYIEKQIVNILRVLSKREDIDIHNQNKQELEHVEVNNTKINPHRLLLSQSYLFDEQVKQQIDYLKLLKIYSPKTKLVGGKLVSDLLQIDLPPANAIFQDENKQSSVYVYAGYVRPGKHTIILYDRYSDSFYQKNMLIQPASCEDFTHQSDFVEVFDSKCYKVNRIEMLNGGEYSLSNHQEKLLEQHHLNKVPKLMYIADMSVQKLYQNKLLFRMIMENILPKQITSMKTKDLNKPAEPQANPANLLNLIKQKGGSQIKENVLRQYGIKDLKEVDLYDINKIKYDKQVDVKGKIMNRIQKYLGASMIFEHKSDMNSVMKKYGIINQFYRLLQIDSKIYPLVQIEQVETHLSQFLKMNDKVAERFEFFKSVVGNEKMPGLNRQDITILLLDLYQEAKRQMGQSKLQFKKFMRQIDLLKDKYVYKDIMKIREHFHNQKVEKLFEMNRAKLQKLFDIYAQRGFEKRLYKDGVKKLMRSHSILAEARESIFNKSWTYSKNDVIDESLGQLEYETVTYDQLVIFLCHYTYELEDKDAVVPPDKGVFKLLNKDLIAYNLGELQDEEGRIFSHRKFYDKLKLVIYLLQVQIYKSLEEVKMEQQRLLLPDKVVQKKKKSQIIPPTELELKALNLFVKEMEKDKVLHCPEDLEEEIQEVSKIQEHLMQADIMEDYTKTVQSDNEDLFDEDEEFYSSSEHSMQNFIHTGDIDDTIFKLNQEIDNQENDTVSQAIHTSEMKNVTAESFSFSEDEEEEGESESEIRSEIE